MSKKWMLLDVWTVWDWFKSLRFMNEEIENRKVKNKYSKWCSLFMFTYLLEVYMYFL
jgi:hypothetical protein